MGDVLHSWSYVSHTFVFNLVVFPAAATAGLDGVALQWKRLFEPYVLNFVQYRLVTNLTLAAAFAFDTSSFTTLPMVFQNGLTRSFTVPRAALMDGSFYEFRLGFTFATYTYYTNILLAKTFDANSPFVGNVKSVSSDSSITVTWSEPEYNDGIVGYKVSVLYRQPGNGGLVNPSWDAGSLSAIASIGLPLTKTNVTVGCLGTETSGCLSAYTTYLIQISVLRQAGLDVPKSIYVSTLRASPNRFNTSSLSLYGGWLTINFTAPIPQYDNVPLSSTFLQPARVRTQLGDIDLDLANSTVHSTSATSVKIVIDYAGFEYLYLTQSLNARFYWTTASLQYSGDASIVLSIYCLMT
jgi:hypothetical protein